LNSNATGGAPAPPHHQTGDTIVLNIEFTGQITANDNEIRAAIARAEAVFAAAGITPEAAAAENEARIEEAAETTQLWSQADYAATSDMVEGAQLVWR
jgi:hypothetical protein